MVRLQFDCREKLPLLSARWWRMMAESSAWAGVSKRLVWFHVWSQQWPWNSSSSYRNWLLSVNSKFFRKHLRNRMNAKMADRFLWVSWRTLDHWFIPQYLCKNLNGSATSCACWSYPAALLSQILQQRCWPSWKSCSSSTSEGPVPCSVTPFCLPLSIIKWLRNYLGSWNK